MQKRYRLTNNKAFDYAYKKGKSISNKDIVLLYVPTKYSLRVGFSVSKKIGKAVVRNKVKRRLKEGFRSLIPNLDNGYNYVVVARVGIADKSYKQLLDSTVSLITKAGLFKKSV